MYRFVKITSFYRGFLEQYYRAYPDIASRPYAEQYRHLMDQAFGWADFYAAHLKAIGVDAHEIVTNATSLQKSWALEQGLPYKGEETILDQLRTIRPDVILFQDSISFDRSFIDAIRVSVPTVKRIIGFCCTIYTEAHVRTFRSFDSLIVCSPAFSNEFKRRGFNVHELHHAFESSLLPRLESNNRYSPVNLIFTGSIMPGSNVHELRTTVLTDLLRSNSSMSLYAQIPDLSSLLLSQAGYMSASILKRVGLRKLVSAIPKLRKAAALDRLPRRSGDLRLIRKHARPPLYGLEMFKALSRSRITFNIHGEGAGDYAANVRLFEATGVGSCLITDWKKNLSELFEPDSEVVDYRSSDECLEKVKWLMNHPDECRAIAQRGQRRTLKDHNYALRAGTLHEIITSLLKR